MATAISPDLVSALRAWHTLAGTTMLCTAAITDEGRVKLRQLFILGLVHDPSRIEGGVCVQLTNAGREALKARKAETT